MTQQEFRWNGDERRDPNRANEGGERRRAGDAGMLTMAPSRNPAPERFEQGINDELGASGSHASGGNLHPRWENGRNQRGEDPTS